MRGHSHQTPSCARPRAQHCLCYLDLHRVLFLRDHTSLASPTALQQAWHADHGTCVGTCPRTASGRHAVSWTVCRRSGCCIHSGTCCATSMSSAMVTFVTVNVPARLATDSSSLPALRRSASARTRRADPKALHVCCTNARLWTDAARVSRFCAQLISAHRQELHSTAVQSQSEHRVVQGLPVHTAAAIVFRD